MNKLIRTWIINGEQHVVKFAPLKRLLDVLRDDLDLFSLKEGCGEGECGACSAMINGDLKLCCLIAAAQLDDGAEILTVEGLAKLPLGRALQKAYDQQGAVQCGYCTPGMLMGSYALLRDNPTPSEEQIRTNLAGNLCRCTGYSSIIKAVGAAGKEE